MNRSIAPLVICGGCLFILFAIASIMLGEGNTLANLFGYLMVAGVFFAMVAPRPAFFVFIILCGYVDLFKRFMVVTGRVSMDDLLYILGLAPVMLAGIVASVFIRGIMGQITMTRQRWLLLAAGCLIVLVNAALSAMGEDKSVGAILKGIANGGFYGMMVFVVPMLFRDEADIARLLKFILWIFAPVGIYGIAQQAWGFQDFEIAYLQTGLSIEIKQLFANRVRAFSTLNSPTALGAIAAVLMVLPLYLAQAANRSTGKKEMRPVFAIIFAAIYGGALVASTSRSALIVVLAMLAGMHLFRGKTGTLAVYASSLLIFITMLAGARFFQDRLDVWTQMITQKMQGGFGEEMMKLQTFSDRLQGFAAVLTNPSAYTLFGHGLERGRDPSDPLYNHDLLSSILVQHGVVALVAVIVMGGVFLAWIHRNILGIKDRGRRRMAAAMAAMVISLIAISVASGSVLSVFPVNVFFWLAVAATILLAHEPAKMKSRDSVPAQASIHPLPKRNRRLLPQPAAQLASP